MNELKNLLNSLIPKPTNCHDCGAKPGEIHNPNCDVTRCSSCGGQRLQCNCPDHDPAFARWTGFWPGKLECIALGMITWDRGEPRPDLNRFVMSEYPDIFFVKPKVKAKAKKKAAGK
jgi:hypothetical protein